MAIVGGTCKLEACGAEAKAPPSIAGEVLCFRLANAVHIEAREPYGSSRVARSPWNKVGMSIGYCCTVLIRTNSIAISADGAEGPPFSTVLATTTRRVRKYSVARNGRSGKNAKLLQGLEGSSTRRSIEVVGEICQQNLKATGPEDPFIILS